MSINVDFPLPETPVTQVNVPTGSLNLLLRLLPLAPFISINLPFLADLLFLELE